MESSNITQQKKSKKLHFDVSEKNKGSKIFTEKSKKQSFGKDSKTPKDINNLKKICVK